MKKRQIIVGIIIIIIVFWSIGMDQKNTKLKKNTATLLFENQKVKAVNISPGECVFERNGEKYLLSISTEYQLKYVDMDTLSTEDPLPEKKYVWYRVHGPITRDEAEELISIDWKKIEKGDVSCDQRFAIITKM